MELGSQATPFEHRSFGEELALCQRYFYQELLMTNANVFWKIGYIIHHMLRCNIFISYQNENHTNFNKSLAQIFKLYGSNGN